MSINGHYTLREDRPTPVDWDEARQWFVIGGEPVATVVFNSAGQPVDPLKAPTTKT